MIRLHTPWQAVVWMERCRLRPPRLSEGSVMRWLGFTPDPGAPNSGPRSTIVVQASPKNVMDEIIAFDAARCANIEAAIMEAVKGGFVTQRHADIVRKGSKLEAKYRETLDEYYRLCTAGTRVKAPKDLSSGQWVTISKAMYLSERLTEPMKARNVFEVQA